MREIKFRYFDEKAQKMLQLKQFHFDNFRKKYKVMQYTGLKDRKGVESYICDIAKDEFGNIFEITDDYMLLAHLQTIKFEIVGNIYEHSHLLLETAK